MSQEMQDGSVKTLWRVSLPLILSFLSTLGMVTVDRLFLAQYSAESLSAAVSGGMAAWALTFGGQTLTAVSAIFVAQHNGANRYEKVGTAVWQTIWLSAALIVPFFAAAVWFAPWAFSDSPIETEQVLYYRWTMAVSPLLCLLGGLNGFFIGRGKTIVITWLMLFGNSLNFVLDPILIFGLGPIPALGISGACMATGAGLLAQTGALFTLFLKKENRNQYGTGQASLDWKTVRDMIRIGSPEALATTLELGAWAAFFSLLSHLSALHILVASVGQSMLMAFFFFGIGLEQGIASVCGNLIGAEKKDEVAHAFRSGMKIVALFGIVLFIFLWASGNWIINLFLDSPENMSGVSSLTPAQLSEAKEYVRQSLFVIGAYIAMENVRCLLYGILRAAGDTFFILILSVLATWSLLLLPTYVLLTLWKMPVHISFLIWLSYAFLTTVFCYVRFAKGGWRRKQIFSYCK